MSRKYKHKPEEPVVDSTKGRSNLNPLNYKGDVMVQVWLDSRLLVTLNNWLETSGEYPRFLSDVVRKPLEVLIDHVVNEGEVEMVDDTALARMLLQRKFNIKLNKGDKGKKNTLHNLLLSDKRGKLADNMNKRRIIQAETEIGKRKTVVSQEEMDKMLNIFNNLPNNQKQGQSLEEVLQLAKDSGVIVSEKSEKSEKSKDKLERAVSVKEVNAMSGEEYVRKREKLDKERIKAEREVDLSQVKTVKE